jgi:hypothetical protein
VTQPGSSLRNIPDLRTFGTRICIIRLRAIREACILNLKMIFTYSRFEFTFRYWRSFGSLGAASAE